MDELVVWLRAQLDEDERIARGATPGPWVPDEPLLADWVKSGILGYVADCSIGAGYRAQSIPDAAFIAAHDPARVLREIEAKRRIVDRYAWLREHGDTGGTAWVLPLLALPYADRPGYREEWRP